jgi:hypothetical protein
MFYSFVIHSDDKTRIIYKNIVIIIVPFPRHKFVHPAVTTDYRKLKDGADCSGIRYVVIAILGSKVRSGTDTERT